MEKVGADTSWGGHSGYISDPDKNYWEGACSEYWKFNAGGSLVLE